MPQGERLKAILTVATTGTGIPFRRVGSYRHRQTAADAEAGTGVCRSESREARALRASQVTSYSSRIVPVCS